MVGRYFFGDNNIGPLAGFVKDGTNLLLKRVAHVKLTQEDTFALAKEFIKLLPHIFTKAEYAKEREVFMTMMRDLFPNLLERISYLEAFTVKIAKYVNLPYEL